MSDKLSPLYKLLKSGIKWQWSNKKQKSFELIKQELTSAAVLTLFNPSYPIISACDASEYGIGAVISHELPDESTKPIAFASSTLTKAETNYS